MVEPVVLHAIDDALVGHEPDVVVIAILEEVEPDGPVREPDGGDSEAKQVIQFLDDAWQIAATGLSSWKKCCTAASSFSSDPARPCSASTSSSPGWPRPIPRC